MLLLVMLVELLATTTLSEVEVESLASATTTSATTSEEVSKDVIHVHVHVLATTWLTLSLLLLANTLLSKLIVDSSLLWVRKGLIRICDLLEFLLGCVRVVQILVWMVLDGKLLECLLQLGIISVPLHSQQVIVVFSLLLGFLLLLLSLLSSSCLGKSS